MPYYLETDDRDLLKKLMRRNVCAECGGELEAFYDLKRHLPYLQCKATPGHEGIGREPTRYEMEGLASLNIPTKREILKKEYGELTTELEQYQGGGQLTQEAAMSILKLVYPKCPEVQIIRTAILCRDFGLHPLMKEVYLIPFKNKEGGQDWATVIGITANRKIASAKKGAFSFEDDSPRAASHTEIVKQFGDNSHEEQDNIVSICKLRGEKGNTATGFGLYPKNANPYGTDKGNTPRNMANIRAERLALDRLPGAPMPLKNLDVIDVAYADVPEIGKVDKGTGEILEGVAREIPSEDAPPPDRNEPPSLKEHWCEEHGCEYERKTRGSAIWYAHKKPDGKWCNEKKKANGQGDAEEPAAEESDTEPAAAPPPAMNQIDLDWVTESLATLRKAKIQAWDERLLLEYMKSSYGVEAATVIEAVAKLDKGQAIHFTKRIQETLDLT